MGILSDIEGARAVLADLGMDAARSNERSALTLLALASLRPGQPWAEATNDMYTTRQLMDWFDSEYDVHYAANTRETIRKDTLHPFIEGGIVEVNADDPSRPQNSPKWNYRLSKLALELVRSVGTEGYTFAVHMFNSFTTTWNDLMDERRGYRMVPVTLPNGQSVKLSPGGQNLLIRDIIEQFCPRFAPGGEILFIDDTDKEHGETASQSLEEVGIELSKRGKSPDLVVWQNDRQWLFLIEACSSHGPIDVARKAELSRLFSQASGSFVFVSCFPTRKVMQRYLADLAWETEAWCADSPDHMIHLDGERFMGPYGVKGQ